MPALAAPRRVTVVGETGRIDVALPAQSTIAELIPVLVRAIAGPSGPQGRFEVSRVGGLPLPGEQTVAAAGLRDGELLHLVAVGHGTAVAVFDDLVEAVAANVRDAPGRWRPALSRRFAGGVAVLAFGGAATAAATMATWPAGPIAAGLMAVLLLAAGVTLTRVRDAAAIGAALAGAGLLCMLSAVFGWATGWYASGLTGPATAAVTAGPGGAKQSTAADAVGTDGAAPAAVAAGGDGAAPGAAVAAGADGAAPAALGSGPAGAAQAAFEAGVASAMVAAFSAVVLYALLSAALLPVYRARFLTAAATGGAGAIAAGAVAAGYAAPGSAAAVLVVLAVLTSPAFPILSLRLGRLPVPEVPTDIATFRATDKPAPATEVTARTLAAESALTSLLAAEAVIVLAGGAVLLRTGSITAWILVGLAGLALVIRSRAYLSVAQRATLLTAGTLVLVTTAVRCTLHGGIWAPPAVGALGLLTGIGCAVHAVRAGHRPQSPYWARFLDIVDFVSVTALIPAGAAVLGLYGAIQSLAA